jgi:hypothetical protein
MLSPVLLTAALTLGAWGPGGCGPVGSPVVPVVVQAEPAYEWRPLPFAPWQGLFHHGVPVGGWNPDTRTYRPYDAASGTWGPVTTPPWSASDPACTCCDGCPCGGRCRCAEDGPCTPACACGPTKKVAAKEPEANFGIIRDKLHPQTERYILNGQPVPRERAWQAITDAQVPDDAGRPRLTVIGADAERQAVLRDLDQAPALAEFKDRLLVQTYPPDHWAVSATGFVTTGHPTIYLQAADGTVLHRQDAYAGPDDLAAVLRRADPHYDPSKDPDLRPSALLTRFQLSRVPTAVWLLAAGVLFLLLRKGKS